MCNIFLHFFELSFSRLLLAAFRPTYVRQAGQSFLPPSRIKEKPKTLKKAFAREIAFSSSRVMLENDKFPRNKQEKLPAILAGETP